VGNDGPALISEKVVGQSLWQFIEDEPTREIYRQVLDRVRSGAAAEFTLRCDAPDRRRLIEMTVSGRPEAQVEFRTHLLSAKARPWQPLLASSTPRSNARLLACGWCNRVHVETDEWLEVEEATDRLHLDAEPELARVDHVVCPDCFAKMTEILARMNPEPASRGSA
jgi:hypothetical protein